VFGCLYMDIYMDLCPPMSVQLPWTASVRRGPFRDNWQVMILR
jgi:hypothetical protein